MYFLMSALIIGPPNWATLSTASEDPNVYLWPCVTYSSGRASKRSVSTYRGGQEEREIALYESTLVLELRFSGQLVSEKTQGLQNGFRDI